MSATVYAQPSTHANCICYTERQDINCLRCLLNEPINDSIISDQIKIIELKTLEAESIQFDLMTCNKRSIELVEDNAKLTTKVKRRGRVIGGTVIGGIILGAVAVLK